MNLERWGNQPMPCVKCCHPSRDHDRSKKQPDGSWNGKCLFPDCECRLYVKPKSMKYANRFSFDELVKTLRFFQVTQPLYNETELEIKLKKYLESKGYVVSRQETVKGIGRNDLVVIFDDKKICLELKVNTTAFVARQIDTYISHYKDGVILVCWHASETLRQVFKNVKPTIKIPIELVEIKSNQMIV